jgi:phosphoglycolate phosphatase
MIGDRADDIVGAKKNKISSIGVLYGYGTQEEIKAEQPAHIISSVNELHKLLIRKER